jgi:hypothetical protein
MKKFEIIPNVIYEEIITDIAGNQFIVKYYTDLDGNIKKDIKVYNPIEKLFNSKQNNKIYCSNI